MICDCEKYCEVCHTKWTICDCELKAKDQRIQELEATLAEAERALNQIASWKEGEIVNGSFDEPGSATIAREALNHSRRGSINETS